MPRAGKDDAKRGVVGPTRFKDGELCAGIDREIRLGIGHGVHVTGLSRQIEQDVLVAQKYRQTVTITHVGDIDIHQMTDAGQIEEIAAVLGDQRIHDGDLGSLFDQGPGEVGPNKPQAAGDQDPAVAIGK